jgi:hypothetical protein
MNKRVSSQQASDNDNSDLARAFRQWSAAHNEFHPFDQLSPEAQHEILELAQKLKAERAEGNQPPKPLDIW